MVCSAPCPTVEILDENTFGQIGPEWDELLHRGYDNRIFSTPRWHRIWWMHFGPGGASILTARNEGGTLEAVLPLQVTSRGGERVLSLLGDFNVADYMEAAAEKQHARPLLACLWREAWRELDWDRVELRHVPSSSPLIPSLQEAAAEAGASATVEPDEVCPVALLCNTWDGYLQMLSKKQRHEVRRKLRRAQEGVEWHWRTAASQEDLRRDLEVFFRLHGLSAREKARFMSDEMHGFFSAVAEEYRREGALRLSVFHRDGVDVAATMSFLHRDRFLLYNSGYDPAFAVYSPGIASVALAMQDAIAEKAVAFDFLSGDEPYKYQFGATNTYTCRLSVKR